MRTFKHFSRVLVFLLFAFWFGGLTFYVSVVIPNGINILGEVSKMGLITQKATRVLNISSMLFIFAALLFITVNYRDYRRPLRILHFVLIALLLTAQIYLNYLHGVMDTYLIGHTLNAADRGIFMTFHRTYEILTPFSWILGVVWCFISVPRKRRRIRIRRAQQEEQINLTNP